MKTNTAGQKIRERREQLEYSLEETVRGLYISYSTLSRIETGIKKKIPDYDIIEGLEEKLNFDRGELRHYFEEDRKAKAESKPSYQEIAERVNKKEQYDSYLSFATMQLRDIREDIAYGVPLLAARRVQRLIDELKIGAEWVRKAFNQATSWDYYKLLSWALYERVIAYSRLKRKEQSLGEALKDIEELNRIAKLYDSDIPLLIANMIKSFGHYMAGNYIPAVKYATITLDQLNQDVPLSYGSWYQPLQILRTKAIGSAKLGDQDTAKKTIKKLIDLSQMDLQSPVTAYKALEGKARTEAILGYNKAWSSLETASKSRNDEFQTLRLMEIRTSLETIYYLKQPDRGHIRDLRKEAHLVAGQDVRHLEQVDKLAKRALSLKNVGNVNERSKKTESRKRERQRTIKHTTEAIAN